MHCSAHTALRLCPQLFKFTDLLGFSLTFKDGFYAHSLHLPSRGGSDASKSDLTLGLADQESESEPVFARLWDMLTLRCPDLESLSIVGNSSEPSDAARLHTATWPKLRYLAFGSVIWNASAPGEAHANPDFVEFLERHPTLESLHLLGRPSSNQVDLSTLSPDALPNLKEFSGSFNLLLDALDGTYCTFDGGDDPSEDAVGTGIKQDCGTKNSALVYSVSYAGGEDDDIHYMERQCTEFGKARPLPSQLPVKRVLMSLPPTPAARTHRHDHRGLFRRRRRRIQ